MGNRKVLVGLIVVAMLALVGLALAQETRGGRGGGGGAPGDQASRAARQMARIQAALGASEAEWKVLEPKIQLVMTRSREAQIGRGMYGRPGAAPATAETPLAKAAADLQKALDNPQATSEQITERLAAVRAAQKTADAALAAARESLRSSANTRQEAHLVLLGILL
jgi:predicted negative regulator of RcsB-dependent stress response